MAQKSLGARCLDRDLPSAPPGIYRNMRGKNVNITVFLTLVIQFVN